MTLNCSFLFLSFFVQGVLPAPLAKLLQLQLSLHSFGFVGKIINVFALLALQFYKRFLFLSHNLSFLLIMSQGRDLNSWPSPYHGDALPTELPWQQCGQGGICTPEGQRPSDLQSDALVCSATCPRF